MKRSRWIVLLLTATCLFCNSIRAEDEKRKADHEALRTLRNKVLTAINNRDIKQLMSCFAPEFVFISVNQVPLTSAKQIENFFKKNFNSSDSKLVSMKCRPEADIPTRFIGKNTGYCYGTNEDTYTLKDGGKVTIKSRWTALVTKDNGEWKLVMAQAGVNFLDNPVLDHVANTGYKLMIYGFVAGLLISLLIMLIIYKLKAKHGRTPDEQ